MKNKPIDALLIVAVLLTSALPLYAVKTRKMKQSSFSSFERGKGPLVSILNGGELTPARRQTLLLDSGDPYVWDLVMDRHENLYIATGNDGRVYQKTFRRDSVLFFDAQELQVFALAIDSRDRLLVGTSPRGKLYRVSAPGSAQVLFEPKEPYIWDVVVDAQDNLFVATGDPGRIYKIQPDGQVQLFFDSEHAHIRCLALDPQGRLYAGSSQKGIVYRFSADGKAFALYDPQVTEVHALVIANNGTVYAATLNEPPSNLNEQLARQLVQQTATSGNSPDSEEVTLAAQPIVTLNPMAQAQSSLLRIDPNGYSRDIWDYPQDTIQSLLMTKQGLLVGTGSEGKIFRLNNENEADLLCRFTESPVTALLAHGDQWIVGTANMGRVILLDAERAEQAVFESEPIDASMQSRWGILEYEGDFTDGRLRFFTRSGNTEQPGPAWSNWQPVEARDGMLAIVSPSARFIQWKVLFGKKASNPPVLRKVAISYQAFNLPPQISTLIVHEPGSFYETDESRKKVSANRLDDLQGLVYPQNLPSSTYKKGARSADWIFDDPNLDPLLFDLYYQQLFEGPWLPLVTDAAVNIYSWDSFQMADGQYRLKVVAKDTPGNPKDRALFAEKISDPFIVDNSGPILQEFATQQQGDEVWVTLRFADEWNSIDSADWSLNSGGWQPMDSEDGLNDSKTEVFRLQLPAAAKSVHFLALRAIDQAGNIRVEHKLIRSKP